MICNFFNVNRLSKKRIVQEIEAMVKKKTNAAKFQVTILFMMRMMFIVMILKMMT